MKKLIPFLLVFCTLACLAGCRGSKEAPYDRSDYKQEYERRNTYNDIGEYLRKPRHLYLKRRFLSMHIFR